MSAWLCGKAHIDALVQELAVRRIITFEEANATGAMLRLENRRSLHARYGDPIPDETYTFEGVEAPLDPRVMYKAVRCYDYQACEHAEWEDSQAYNLMEQLGNAILTELGILDPSAVYLQQWWIDADGWPLDRIEQAILKREVA